MPSMHSVIIETPSIEREKRDHFALGDKQTRVRSMRQFGQLDEDTPVTIPVVQTNFMMQPASQPIVSAQSPHNDIVPGMPPLPSGRYKKHSSDPTRYNQPLASISRSSTLSRSKSCGEGRSSEPSDALDVLSRKASTQRLGSGAPLIDKSTQDSTGNYKDGSGFEPPKASTASNFKCCIYLPGISSKKKPVQARSESHLSSFSVEGDNVQKTNTYTPDLGANAAPADRASVISKVASLERFNLSSVSSDIVIDCWDERHGSSYFDLPMELISSGENETDLPINSAFVFENDRRTSRRKKKSSSSRIASSKTSYEMSSRHSNNLRISASGKVSDASSMRSSQSSACIEPKIRKAREELNAFVEAHGA
ncbi:root hair specific protein [Rhynchospora pubera]|uniref:Root hair specific protein n=1 Tax=Rhynchospora pubera TaxID=906938 RepID=A0AAV8H8Y1_9POAL|nr:root hair specific protein [Rhynchospora pubera]